MTVVDSLMAIAEWLNENPCKRFEFKVPPEDQRKPINDDYEYKRVHPHAFPVYVPTKDMLPPNIISNMPSLCVQLVQGEDDNALLQRELRINIGISCWNPGIHAGDMYYPKNMEPTAQVKYKNGYDGWMDAWNFVDDILRRLGSINNIGNLVILKNKNITYGPYKEQESIPDYYPHWFAWIQFSVRSDFLRNNEEIEQFL